MAEIEYYYSAHSAFAYLGSARLMEIVAAGGHTIIHKPYDLRHVLKVIKTQSFAERSKAHLDYYFGREIERWSEYRNAPVGTENPTHHAKDFIFANRILIACIQQGFDVNPLAHRMLVSHWRDDSDLSDEATLAALTAECGFNAEALMALARTDEIGAIHDTNTQEAIDRSVFGSPTYFLNGDMFYGQDHLEMLERALTKPFAGKWPRH